MTGKSKLRSNGEFELLHMPKQVRWARGICAKNGCLNIENSLLLARHGVFPRRPKCRRRPVISSILGNFGHLLLNRNKRLMLNRKKVLARALFSGRRVVQSDARLRFCVLMCIGGATFFQYLKYIVGKTKCLTYLNSIGFY